MSTDGIIDTAMTNRALTGRSWTYAEMAGVARRAGGSERDANRFNQRWRKRGWAKFARVNNSVWWDVTDAGKAAHA